MAEFLLVVRENWLGLDVLLVGMMMMMMMKEEGKRNLFYSGAKPMYVCVTYFLLGYNILYFHSILGSSIIHNHYTKLLLVYRPTRHWSLRKVGALLVEQLE
jgi:hypothetical protein